MSGKIVVVSQHYPPDQSTTASIMAAIASHLALEHQVIVFSGTQGFANDDVDGLTVVEIKNRFAKKGALVKRAVTEIWFAARVFFALSCKLKSGDVALTVTAPFSLPYAVAAAAFVKRAKAALIMHDLYPDVLVMAGLLNGSSIFVKALHAVNSLMFRAMAAVIIIGRDAEKALLRYRAVTPEKIKFIPNWATLDAYVRPVRQDNPFRRQASDFVIGLSGNLGFTHDPEIVFEAAHALREDSRVSFLLSGRGVGL